MDKTQDTASWKTGNRELYYQMLDRDHFFQHLYGGGYYRDADTLLADADRLGVSLRGKGFLVLSFRPEKWGCAIAPGQADTTEGLRDLQFILRNTLEEFFDRTRFSVQAAEYRGNCICLFTLLQAEPDCVRAVCARALEAVAFFEEELSISVSVAVSRLQIDPMTLHTALLETEKVFEYTTLVNEDAQVTAYDDLTPGHIPAPYANFLQLESKLISCIHINDFEGARMIVHEMATRGFQDSRPSIETVRLRIYGMVNCLFNMMDEIHERLGDEVCSEIDYGRRLTEAETLPEILAETDRIFDSLCAFTAAQRKDAPPQWLTQIRSYIDENFRNVDVTVAFVTEKFNISPSYCARVFRQYVGTGLFDYIQLHRLEAAKVLLRGNLSVRAAAEQSGFSSPLTMNRAFKRYEGSNPSLFKRQS